MPGENHDVSVRLGNLESAFREQGGELDQVARKVNGHEIRLNSLEGLGKPVETLIRAINGSGVPNGEKGLIWLMGDVQDDIKWLKEKLSRREKNVAGIVKQIVWTLLSAAAGAIFLRLFVGK